MMQKMRSLRNQKDTSLHFVPNSNTQPSSGSTHSRGTGTMCPLTISCVARQTELQRIQEDKENDAYLVAVLREEQIQLVLPNTKLKAMNDLTVQSEDVKWCLESSWAGEK